MEIEFTVDGTPIPQGSKSCFCKNNKAILAEAGGHRHKKWRETVSKKASEIAKESNWELLDGPIGVELQFRLERPASKPAWKEYDDVKPDADKLTRAILDSITKTIIVNDSRVVRLFVEKRYATTDNDPGVDIRVYSIEDKIPTLFED